jgi:hypothetical protein
VKDATNTDIKEDSESSKGKKAAKEVTRKSTEKREAHVTTAKTEKKKGA